MATLVPSLGLSLNNEQSMFISLRQMPCGIFHACMIMKRSLRLLLAWSTMRFMCGDQESSSDNGHIDYKISNLRTFIKNRSAPWNELVT